MTTWRRRLRSRRWIRTWLLSDLYRRFVVLAVLASTTLTSVLVVRLGHKKNVDQAEAGLLLFAGFAVLFSIALLVPSRETERREREERRHRRRVERNLSRLVELLERRSTQPPLPPQPIDVGRRGSSWLAVLAVVVLAWRLLRSGAQRGSG